MSEARAISDVAQREAALDPSRSFIVQAPAGSGKTELLIQRYLALLGQVERPEEIAAITFTIKAAAEMRLRVLDALRAARHEPRPEAPHHARTWDLARAALDRNDASGWNLEESADRLRVQTIDALCMGLTRQMPVLSRFGAQPEVIEDATLLFAEAARSLLERIDGLDAGVARDVGLLLGLLDNDAARAEELLAGMLAQRDHWLRALRLELGREALEAALESVRRARVAEAVARWPAAHPAPGAGDVGGWVAHAKGLLTQKREWRAAAPAHLKTDAALLEALGGLCNLPDARYSDEQWAVLEAILRLAPQAVAELAVVFAKHGKADFVEFSQGALRALGTEDEPTDLLLVLDYRIRHILVDEFQDTSHSQFELLERLTSGWEPGDGRTLFVVGDPMQSIYRFRQAEVALFLRAQREGIGAVALTPLTLAANFRSQAGVVEWVNDCFARLMPREDDIHGGAVAYSPSQAVHAAEHEAVHVHAFFDDDGAGEGLRIAEIATRARAEGASVAILVRNRAHLLEVLPCLREAGLGFRAVEIESLGHRPAVQDLLALTRALAHPADRVAWLAVLRAPWCALTLADLHAIGANETVTIWEALEDASHVARLSEDGLRRASRVRAVLGPALAGRRRSSLRDAVEGAWLALGGPACVETDTDLEDARTYLDHLEATEEAGALADLDTFEKTVAKLFALPDLEAPEALQVMTIHKAKGLEFDTVIVPGLAAGGGKDDRKLFLWMETAESELLVAPVNPTGSDKDPLYELIRGLDKRKAAHETARLLYVAATRARKRLHLLGNVRRDKAGAWSEPTKGTLLHALWPVVAHAFQPPAVDAAGEPRPQRTVPASRQARLRRLAVDAFAPVAPARARWAPPPERAAAEPIEFSWVGDTARRVGSVVHRWLQRIAEDEARGWTRARVERERAAIANELAARGVVQADIATATVRVIAAVGATLDDERGRWLLGPQPNARNEYRISAIVDGVRHDLVIDRVFEDLTGAWIVDYKTSSHEGADPARFLADQEERYRAQLDRYAAALGKPGARRGLYFPLLKGWREWN